MTAAPPREGERRWKAVYYPRSHAWGIVNEDGIIIVSYRFDDHHNLSRSEKTITASNFRLLAAAPELLQALKDVMIVCNVGDHIRLRELIAKAEGRE